MKAKGIIRLIVFAIFVTAAYRTVVAGDLKIVPARDNAFRASAEAQVTSCSNLFVEPCGTCDYNPNPSGFSVRGPDNCSFPGDVQRVAVSFIAAASGVPERVSASIILQNPTDCPTNKVILSIYTDACYPNGPGTLLVSGEATVPASPCDLAVARLRNAPSLTKGTKYWVTATTNASQVGLDARWYASNNAKSHSILAAIGNNPRPPPQASW